MSLTLASAVSALPLLQGTATDRTQGAGKPAVSATAAQSSQASTNDGAYASTSAQVSPLVQTSDALSQAASIADTAQAGANAVLQILQQLKSNATQASDDSLSTADRATLSTHFTGLVKQLRATVAGASAGGVNLIDGSAAAGVQVTAGPDGAQATLKSYDLTPGKTAVALTAATGVATAGAAAAALGQVQSSLDATSGVLTNLSAQAKQINAHADFVATLGASAGVTGDGAPDGADGVRLQALQLRQSLAVQPEAIANAGAASVLALFRESAAG